MVTSERTAPADDLGDTALELSVEKASWELETPAVAQAGELVAIPLARALLQKPAFWVAAGIPAT